MVHSYATLSALEAQIIASDQNIDAPILAENRARLMAYARRVTSRIDEMTHDLFAPLRQTRYFDCIGEHIDRWTRAISLNASIADVVTLTDGAGKVLVLDTDWRYHPRGKRSTMLLEGLTDSTWTNYADNWRQAVRIDGMWCYRERYDVVGWIGSADTVQTTPLTTTATSVTVTDVDGANAWGLSPRFDVGQMIRIGAEYMAVMGVNTITNVLTVVRAYNGTTATEHVTGASISTFDVQPEIVRACALITAFNYQTRGKFERVRFDGINATETIEIPDEARELVAMYTISNARGVYGG